MATSLLWSSVGVASATALNPCMGTIGDGRASGCTATRTRVSYVYAYSGSRVVVGVAPAQWRGRTWLSCLLAELPFGAQAA
eukprot:scaffold125100_cov58-Phaeocystis_antarctica.AAC.3